MNIDNPSVVFENLLDEGANITIIGHFNPDGDAIGATTGLRNYLKSKGIDSQIVLPSHAPDHLKFLDPDETIHYYVDEKKKVKRLIAESDLIVCLDFNRLSRTEWLEDDIAASKSRKILIDHHLDPEKELFELAISDTAASSTCELLYRTILHTPGIQGDISRISRDTLVSLATGLITDTNNFNNSTSPDTFMMASQLMGAGIDLTEINDKVFKHYTESRMRLMGKLLTGSMTLVHGGYASYMILTQEDKKSHDFKDGDSEGFVNLPLSIAGLEISALFSECDGFVRVSMRSKGKESVNDFCHAYFNGGGHRRASGGRLFIPISEVPRYFTESLEQFLQK